MKDALDGVGFGRLLRQADLDVFRPRQRREVVAVSFRTPPPIVGILQITYIMSKNQKNSELIKSRVQSADERRLTQIGLNSGS